jgi:SNF2-related domain/Helicase conserved C-terminal domain/SWIM zinc finger
VSDPLTARLFNQVDRLSQERGRRYFLRGAVDFVEGDDRSLQAGVQGTRHYDVQVSSEKHVVNVSCTCPFYEREIVPCKHIWAALLAGEKNGFLAGLNKLAAPHLRCVRPDSPAEKTPRPRRSAGSLPPAWKQPLQRLRAVMEAEADHRGSRRETECQLIYLVDVQSTLATQQLVVQIAQRERKIDGNWGKLKYKKFYTRDIPQITDPTDRRNLATLLGAHDGFDYGYSSYSSYGSAGNRFTLSPTLWEFVLPLMCSTGRCFLQRSVTSENHAPLRWDDGDPWDFSLRVVPADDRRGYNVGGILARNGTELALSQADLLLQGGLVFYDGRIARLNEFGAFGWISLLRGQETLFIAKGEADEFMDELLRLPTQPRLDLPEELQFEWVIAQPTPSLVIKPGKHDTWGRNYVAGELSFDYDSNVIAADFERRNVYQKSRRRVIKRDMETEAAAQKRLAQLGFRAPYWTHDGRLELPADRVTKVVGTLTREGWRIEADGKLYRNAGSVRLEISSGVDWFDLEGAAQFGEISVSLPKLLRAIKHGEQTVRLDDGTLGIIPEEWVAKYRLLADLGSVSGQHLRFTRPQVGLLDALLASEPGVSVDALFNRVRDEIRCFAGVTAADPPETFCGELRDYQREGLGWLKFLKQFGFGGCLADDMGLGKTIQVLALLEWRRAERESARGSWPRQSLVVVPRSLVFHWKNEAARFSPQLNILDHTGAARLKPSEHFGEYDLVITTYGTLTRDALHFKNVRFDYCILDEAQAIKNAGTLSAKAARLINADHRMALSGTPIENHLGELWSLFEFLNPGMLGTASIFGGAGRNPDVKTREILARALRPFILRRTKGQVARELPSKTEQTIYCDLDAKDKKLYHELRDYYRARLLKNGADAGSGQFKFQVLEALLRLRQAACHPGLIDKSKTAESSAKIDTLLAQLDQVLEENHKVLVFSQFTSLLAILRSRLDATKISYAYLDGRTRDRQARVEQFQNDPDVRLFLISLKAGGLGLNLHAAEYVYLLDPWWNPAVETQAIDRAHRIGQTRQVFAYRLIARDTVEEKVLELQKSKRDLADAIITADNSLLRSLTREDLELLLS